MRPHTRLTAVLHRLRREQAGLSLIELLVGMGIMVSVLTAMMMLGEVAQRSTPQGVERANAVQTAQTGMARMARELRQAHEVVSSGANSIQVKTFRQGVERTITYDCTQPEPGLTGGNRCVRSVQGVAGSTPAVTRILNGPASASPTAVFTYTTNTATPPQIVYVKTTVETSAKGGKSKGFAHRVALHDGFYLRNRDG